MESKCRLFLLCREAFHTITDTYQWKPASTSPAAEDAAALPSSNEAILEPHGETGHLLIADAVQIFLLGASGQMGGLASLYASAEFQFSPPLLIRAVIENCAHATWVLGDKPEEPAENRLARAYLENLKSAEEAKKNAGRLGDRTGATYLRTAVEYKRLKAQILSRFPGSTRKGLGQWTLHGQQLPGLEASVLWMYALTQKFGGTIDQETASGIYGLLSNLTHPTLYPIREQRVRARGALTDHFFVDANSLERDARMVLAVFYNALSYVTSYFGWPTDELDDLEAEIARSIPDFFR